MNRPLLLSLLLSITACIEVVQPGAPPTPSDPDDLGDEGGPAGLTAITNVRVFDGEKVIPSATVLFDGTIREVGADVAVPAGAQVIDGSGKTLLPGLIDSHTHTWTDADLRQALVLGVTTELDQLGDPAYLKATRARHRAGQGLNEASLFGAGFSVTVPGGHGDFGREPTLQVGQTPAAFVDARVAEGSDWIKLILEDGSGYGYQSPTLSAAQITAAITQVHAKGKRAVVHVSTQTMAARAIQAGADGLIHVYMGGANTQLASSLASQGMFVIPTLSVYFPDCNGGRSAMLEADPLLGPYIGAAARMTLDERWPPGGPAMDCPALLAGVRQLDERGITILAGSDAPNPGTAHGVSLHDELVLLVQAGLTPLEALIAATSAPARVFGLMDRGRVAQGLRADLLLVDGDPTTTISDTRKITGVWKLGVPLDRTRFDEAAAPEPTHGRRGACKH